MLSADQARCRLSALTGKQRDVLGLVLQHQSSKEIARVLDISPYTVDQRISSARQKLGASSRGEVARVYAQLREICGETAYGFSDMAFVNQIPQPMGRDQQQSAPQALSDAMTIDMASDWYVYGDAASGTGLEAFDKRFGIFGRLGAIVVLAAIIAMALLAMVAIAQTLTNLF